MKNVRVGRHRRRKRSDEELERLATQLREYRATHPEESRAYRLEYLATHSEQTKATKARYYKRIAANRKRIVELLRKYKED